MGDAPPILVVEDNDEDFEMLRLTFQEAAIPNPLLRCTDGEETLELLRDAERAPRPCLILLDLNLAGMDGRQVLEQLKADPALRGIPVIVLSTSDNPKDVQGCYQGGGSAYLLKPVDLERFEAMVRHFKAFWLEFVLPPPEPPREGHRR